MDISEGNKDKHGLFLSRLAAVVLGGISLALALVATIDPYNLYGFFVLDGINAVKPELSRHVEEIKLTQAIKLKPDTLILGNSRAEIGFDPESPMVMRHGYSAYNLAIRGTTIDSAARELEYLLKKGVVPKRMVIALDFVDFMQIRPEKSSSESSRLGGSPGLPVDGWFWRFDSLFSMTSIKDALKTLLIQHDEEAATMTRRGFNPLREYEALARSEGYYVLFRQRAEENAKVYLKKAGGRLDDVQVKLFRHLLQQAANSGIEVNVVIYPYHAQILALFEKTGLFDYFTQWKRIVVSEVADISSRQTVVPVKVFDFSGYGPHQCEVIPAKGDLRSVSRWYWEAGHFKKALGELVLQRIFSDSATGESETDNPNIFGTKLNAENFNSNLERIDRERQRCASVNPLLFGEIDALIKGVTKNDSKADGSAHDE